MKEIKEWLTTEAERVTVTAAQFNPNHQCTCRQQCRYRFSDTINVSKTTALSTASSNDTCYSTYIHYRERERVKNTDKMDLMRLASVH